MAYSQSVQSISYQVQNYGGTKRYVYDGKTFNSEQEVMNEIRRKYPGYTLTSSGNSYQGNNFQRNNYLGNFLQNNNQYKNPYNLNNQQGNQMSNHISPPYIKNQYQPSNPSSNVISPNYQKPQYPSPYNPNNNIIPPYSKPSQSNKPFDTNTMHPWLDPKKYIDNDPFSSKIWHYVWDGCHYPCFSKNNYNELKLRMLKETNQYRKYHGVNPLTIDSTLSSVAQNYAYKIASMGKLMHDYTDKRYGENLGMATSFTAYIIVKQWYDEVTKWNFKSTTPIPGTGHFTQLVWAGTQRVGFGVVESNGVTYVVARYDPKGNIVGFYPRNVYPRNRSPNDIY